MATKIVPSDQAPAESVHYTFGSGEFDLGGRTKTFETDDAALISNASRHPWLTVQTDAEELVTGAYVEQLAPADDHLSAVGGINANDPKLAQAAEDAKDAGATQQVAIEAGLTQTTPVETDGVAETVAADDSSKTAAKADTTTTEDKAS